MLQQLLRVPNTLSMSLAKRHDNRDDKNNRQHNHRPDFALLSRSIRRNRCNRRYGALNNNRFAFHLKWNAKCDCCSKGTIYILWLSPRERTCAASPICEAIGSVVRTFFILDIHLRRLRPRTVPHQFYRLAVLTLHIMSK